jgi:YVTN family beta-propeller protein
VPLPFGMPRRLLVFSVIAVILAMSSAMLVVVAQRAADRPSWPGPLGGGITQLPNGWKIAPAGRHAQIGDLPLNMVWSPDGRYIIVTNNGWSSPTLTVFDSVTFQVRATVPVEHAWLGLAWHPDGKRLFSSGAARNVINEFSWNGESLQQAGRIEIAPAALRPTFDTLKGSGFMGGIAVTPDGKRMFAVHVLGAALSMVDLERRSVIKTIELAAEPYSALVSADGRTLFISLWGGAKVLLFDAATLKPKGEVVVGEHPNAMLQSKDGSRLFVACANTNAVWVINLESRRATEQIGVALYPQAPPGTTPNALALSPGGDTLLVANADNNTVAVVDVGETPSKVAGFIPTGWYPTAVTFDGDARNLYVLSGKGLSPSANPRGPSPGSRVADGQYIGQLLQGSLTQVAVPNAEELSAHTSRVYEITAYRDDHRLTPANVPVASPIPRRVGDSSPIKSNTCSTSFERIGPTTRYSAICRRGMATRR